MNSARICVELFHYLVKKKNQDVAMSFHLKRKDFVGRIQRKILN